MPNSSHGGAWGGGWTHSPVLGHGLCFNIEYSDNHVLCVNSTLFFLPFQAWFTLLLLFFMFLDASNVRNLLIFLCRFCDFLSHPYLSQLFACTDIAAKPAHFLSSRQGLLLFLFIPNLHVLFLSLSILFPLPHLCFSRHPSTLLKSSDFDLPERGTINKVNTLGISTQARFVLSSVNILEIWEPLKLFLHLFGKKRADRICRCSVERWAEQGEHISSLQLFSGLCCRHCPRKQLLDQKRKKKWEEKWKQVSAPIISSDRCNLQSSRDFCSLQISLSALDVFLWTSSDVALLERGGTVWWLWLMALI